MYQKVEVQLDTPSLKRDADFEKSLVKLYSNIVYFLACAANYLKHGTFTRTAANIVVWNGWDKHQTDINESAKYCESFSNIVWRNIVLREMQDLKRELETWTSQQSEISKIRNWLSESNPGGDHATIRAKLGSYLGSGRWLVDHNATYIQWRESTSGTLWLKGTVGTGKSSLVSIIIEDLGKRFESDSLAFFYCGGLTATKTEPLTVLRSILAQFACSDNGIDVSEHIRPLYEMRDERMQDKNPRASAADCAQLLSKIIQERMSAIIVVDALDECTRPMELLESFSRIMSEVGSDANLHLLVSSRMDVEERTWMEEVLQPKIILSNSAKTADDIRTFIQKERMNKLRRPNPKIISDEMTQEMEDVLCRLAGGT